MADVYTIARRDGKKGYVTIDGIIAMSWGSWKDRTAVHPPVKANKRSGYGQ